MKVIIIGNGVAGTFSAQNIRALDKEAIIEIYSLENYPYYTRIKLPELISKQATTEDLIVFNEDWYKNKNIKVYLGKKINRINIKHEHIFIEGENEPVSYDKLIFATGSIPNIPSIKNVVEMKGKGVFTLRNMDNGLEIQKYIEKKDVKKGIIIGGGLLGLELAKQIKNCDIETTVVEFFPRLLPRQLDLDCGNMLKDVIEDMGIKVVLSAATEEILGDDKVKGIKLKDDREFEADIVLIQAGIRSTIDLAKQSNLETNRGIIVNQFLETSKKDIYAVGDCIEYKGQTWGIIPACIEQSKIIASSVLGKKHIEYAGTIPKNTLKIVGIDLTSVGIFDPEDTEQVGAGWEIMKAIDKKRNCYKKIVLKDKILKGAILFGYKKAFSYVNKNIESEVNEQEIRKILELFIWECSNCGKEYDEGKMDVLFNYLPEDWKCPECKGPKEGFKKRINFF